MSIPAAAAAGSVEAGNARPRSALPSIPDIQQRSVASAAAANTNYAGYPAATSARNRPRQQAPAAVAASAAPAAPTNKLKLSPYIPVASLDDESGIPTGVSFSSLKKNQLQAYSGNPASNKASLSDWRQKLNNTEQAATQSRGTHSGFHARTQDGPSSRQRVQLGDSDSLQASVDSSGRSELHSDAAGYVQRRGMEELPTSWLMHAVDVEFVDEIDKLDALLTNDSLTDTQVEKIQDQIEAVQFRSDLFQKEIDKRSAMQAHTLKQFESAMDQLHGEDTDSEQDDAEAGGTDSDLDDAEADDSANGETVFMSAALLNTSLLNESDSEDMSVSDASENEKASDSDISETEQRQLLAKIKVKKEKMFGQEDQTEQDETAAAAPLSKQLMTQGFTGLMHLENAILSVEKRVKERYQSSIHMNDESAMKDAQQMVQRVVQQVQATIPVTMQVDTATPATVLKTTKPNKRKTVGQSTRPAEEAPAATFALPAAAAAADQLHKPMVKRAKKTATALAAAAAGVATGADARPSVAPIPPAPADRNSPAYSAWYWKHGPGAQPGHPPPEVFYGKDGRRTNGLVDLTEDD